MNERKNIDREVTSIYLDGETLDEAISTLRQLAEAYGGSAVIRKTSMPYEDYDYLALFVSEPETDQEFQARLAREATELKRQVPKNQDPARSGAGDRGDPRMKTTPIENHTLERLLDAWDTTVLPTHRDGAMQEWMEALRHEFTTCKQEPPISEAGRSSFEEWVKTSHRKRGLSLEKNEKGAYLSNFTNMVWWGWQARGYHADAQNEALVEQR